MNDLSPKQRVFQMLASMAEIVGGSPDLNAERQHLATLIDHCRSWESELATKEDDMRGELCTINLPAGTALKGDRIGDCLRSDAAITCAREDEWLVRTALGLPESPGDMDGQRKLAQAATKGETLEQILVEARAIRVKLEELHTLGSMVCWSGF